MRDSSRDCFACCGRTGYAIEETPRCERCGLVLCDACLPSHLADEHPREDNTPEVPLVDDETVAGWLRSLDERIERKHPGYPAAGWTAVLRRAS